VKGVRYVYWQDGDFWLGYLEEFPDYQTQGESLEDLKDHLRDLYDDLTSGSIPGVRRVAELEVPWSVASSSRRFSRWAAFSFVMAGSTIGIRTLRLEWHSQFLDIPRSTNIWPAGSSADCPIDRTNPLDRQQRCTRRLWTGEGQCSFKMKDATVR